ncbi:MAG: tyrosine-type recombinase/integrase [Pseudomonadota bacterium]
MLRTMDYTWKGLAPRFGHLTPDLVTVDTCRDYIAHRRQQVSDGTIHTELGHLSTVLNWAVKRELIDRAPHVERPAKPAPRDRWLTRKDAMKVIDAASFPHLRLSMILLVGTAARVGAILDLTWDRVDLERGQINLTRASDGAKRKQRATVPINGMVRAALVEAQQGAVTDHVIEWSGKPVASIKKGIAAAAKRAGVEGVSAHVFRHTAAVWMAEANVPMARIAQYLGHRDSRVTERIYARFAPDHLRDEAEILSLPIRAASSFDQ